MAYLKGFVESGNEVVLLSADAHGYAIDPAMTIPEGITCYTYRGMTLYERLSGLKKKANHAVQSAAGNGTPACTRRSLFSVIKKKVFSLYGVHGIYGKFERKARRFRSSEEFDTVVSLSTPASSHLLAYHLLSSGHIKSRQWIQVWEDPWFGDMDGNYANEEVLREERRLLGLAERVCYVSPITLAYQKKRFPESAQKMYWAPLPSYYTEEQTSAVEDSLVFGYFGEYRLPGRNLKPFYQAAKQTDIEVNICGNSNLKLESTEYIHVYPRLDLSQLRPIEQKTGVLVFLCNCKGGQIPGKIYQYAATSKTVLFILDGTEEEKTVLKDFFEKFDRFVFCENDQDSIEAAIQRIKKKELGNVRNRPLPEFSSANIVRQILTEGYNS